MMAAVTAVFAQIVIPLPFSPVPFSLAVLAVFLTGAILDKKHAFLAQLVYVLLGAAGLPILANFQGGLSAVVGPTGGYLITYPLMAFLTAWIAEKIGKTKWYCYYPGMILGLLVCYSLGTAWLAISGKMGFGAALMAGVVPFAVFDLIKIVIASSFAFAVNKALTRAGLRLND